MLVVPMSRDPIHGTTTITTTSMKASWSILLRRRYPYPFLSCELNIVERFFVTPLVYLVFSSVIIRLQTPTFLLPQPIFFPRKRVSPQELHRIGVLLPRLSPDEFERVESHASPWTRRSTAPTDHVMIRRFFGDDATGLGSVGRGIPQRMAAEMYHVALDAAGLSTGCRLAVLGRSSSWGPLSRGRNMVRAVILGMAVCLSFQLLQSRQNRVDGGRLLVDAGTRSLLVPILSDSVLPRYLTMGVLSTRSNDDATALMPLSHDDSSVNGTTLRHVGAAADVLVETWQAIIDWHEDADRTRKKEERKKNAYKREAKCKRKEEADRKRKEEERKRETDERQANRKWKEDANPLKHRISEARSDQATEGGMLLSWPREGGSASSSHDEYLLLGGQKSEKKDVKEPQIHRKLDRYTARSRRLISRTAKQVHRGLVGFRRAYIALVENDDFFL